MILAENLSKKYGTTSALKDVSFSIDKGEIIGLVGPNGAGKTTLVKCLTGVLPPTKGKISIFGMDPNGIDKSRIGVLPQEFRPLELLNVYELLEYYGDLYKNSIDSKIVAEKVGLENKLDSQYKNLSGGQKRRACVGTAIINKPEILFLDEPTTGIDPEGRQDLWNLIEDLKDRDTTVFLTTHYMDEAENLTDKIIMLNNGEIVMKGETEELIQKKSLENRVIINLKNNSVCEIPSEIEEKYNIDIYNNSLVLNGIKPEKIGDIIREIKKLDIRYDGIEWKEPTLEDIYLSMVEDE